MDQHAEQLAAAPPVTSAATNPGVPDPLDRPARPTSCNRSACGTPTGCIHDNRIRPMFTECKQAPIHDDTVIVGFKNYL